MKTQSFTYKPTLFSKPVTFEVSETVLISYDEAGVEAWRLAWPEITGVAFVNHTLSGSRLRRIELSTPDTTQSISYTGGKTAQTADPESVTHLDLLVAILSQLDAHNPDVPLKTGNGPFGQIFMFALGLFFVFAGGGLILMALGPGVANFDTFQTAMPAILMFALGAFLIYTNIPWHPKEKLKVRDLADQLWSIAHPGLPRQR